MLSRALDTHDELRKPKDREWIHILLSFLKAYVDDLGQELLMHEENKEAYISRLVSEMWNAADALDAGSSFYCLIEFVIYCSICIPDIAHPDHPAISIRVSSDAKIADNEDGSFLDVTIQNHLPCVGVLLYRCQRTLICFAGITSGSSCYHSGRP